jgi:hypothetical protein
MRQAGCALELTSNGSSSPSVTRLPPKVVRESPVTIEEVLTKEEFHMLAEHG